MSTQVYIYVNRKSDYQPCGRHYLGGNGLKNAIYPQFQESNEVMGGFSTLPMKDADTVKEWLIANFQELYADSADDILLDNYLLKPNADDFSYWLVFEY